MEEEIKDASAPDTSSGDPIPAASLHNSTGLDPMAAMKAMMEELLAPMKTHIQELTEENKRLREVAEKKEGVGFADNIPNHLRSDDPLVPVEDSRFGRRVVLGTAAADPNFVRREIPQAQGRIVGHGGLVKNTIQNVIGGGDGDDAPR